MNSYVALLIHHLSMRELGQQFSVIKGTGFPGGSNGTGNLPAMLGPGLILGQEDPWRKPSPSVFLPGHREPGALQSCRLQT